MDAGIVSYGAYVPRYRITPAEIGRVWGIDGEGMGQGLNVIRKSVPAPDEDTITISTEALRVALIRGAIDPQQIGALYVGSESHPYAVKPTATVVSQAVGATPNLTAADFEFACKAGTAAIQTCLGMVGSQMIRYGVAIGTDTSQGAPGDALEYSASAGGAAFVIGRENVIVRVHRTLSYTTDTPDFWRREGQRYPSHGGRFTGERRTSGTSPNVRSACSKRSAPSRPITSTSSSTNRTASSHSGWASSSASRTPRCVTAS